MTTETEFHATTDLAALRAASPAFAEAVFRNANTYIILKPAAHLQIDLDPEDDGHTIYYGKPRGMGRATDDDPTGSTA